MSKLVIDYTEMQQLYISYFKLENKLHELNGHIGTLSNAYKSVFVSGSASNLLQDGGGAGNDSVIGFFRISKNVGDLAILAGMVRLHIEKTTNVISEIDEKINAAIVSGISKEYKVSEDVAKKAYNEQKKKDKERIMKENNLTSKEVDEAIVKSTILQ